MARNKRTFNKYSQGNHRPRTAAAATEPAVAAEPPQKKVPVVYGKPFMLLEDEAKRTFEFKSGAWVPYSLTIAQCRQNCQVQEMPQKVKDMTRYEIRAPLV